MASPENYYSKNTSPVSDEIQSRMPDHLEPGSLLHSIRCPPSHFLWLLAKDLGLEKVPRIKNAFYRHVNRRHFGNIKK